MSKSVDLSGKKFGMLTVLEKTKNRNSGGSIVWKCKCDCGNIKEVASGSLNSGNTKSCGCLPVILGINKFLDLTNKEFGILRVVGRIGYLVKTRKSIMWECRCQCGNIKNATTRSLTESKIQSCGCLNVAHKQTHTKLYYKWKNARNRCRNPKVFGFKNYGGKGVSFCKEWDVFLSFKLWAEKNGYQEGLSLDRIDNNGNYEPSNCRWATTKQQANNKTNNVILELNSEPKTLSEWCDCLLIPYKKLAKKVFTSKTNIINYKNYTFNRIDK